jgi:hypothetical protein
VKLRLSAGAAILIVAGIAIADHPTKAPGVVEPVKFSHASHAALPEKVVRDDNCASCHGDSPKGELVPPGKVGHQPCLGCHIDAFMATGARTRKSDEAAWNKATAFCMGCHTAAPQRHEKAKADAVYRLHPKPEYHVEFDHFDHVGLASGCRDCHEVHPVLSRPGHAQCASCHGSQAHAMSACASCHREPGKREYFDVERAPREFRVRHCNSPEHIRQAQKLRKTLEEVPCFRHETDQHRFLNTDPRRRDRWERGEPLQCGHCHFMLEDQKTWKALGHSYRTIKDIKAAPVMDNDRDRAHQRCGDQAACHRRDIDLGAGQCTKCHDQTIVDSLFR